MVQNKPSATFKKTLRNCSICAKCDIDTREAFDERQERIESRAFPLLTIENWISTEKFIWTKKSRFKKETF